MKGVCGSLWGAKPVSTHTKSNEEIMNTITRRTMNAVILGVTLLTAQTVSAYYNPSTGRFLSRDPMGEPGFQLIQRAVPVVQPNASLLESSGRWINRDSSEGQDTAGPYCFVGNNPIGNKPILSWAITGIDTRMPQRSAETQPL